MFDLNKETADTGSLTWLHFLGKHLSPHQDWERISATVGFTDHSDLHRVVHQEVLDVYRPGLSLQGVSILPQGEEAQHLQERKEFGTY